MAGNLSRIQYHTAKIYDLLAASEVRLQSRAVVQFAEKHKLIYFRTVNVHDYSVPVVRGVTAALHQRDKNLCIGAHDGYDLVYVQRQTTEKDVNGIEAVHNWHVMEFDLKKSTDQPLVIVGASSLDKPFYAKVLSEHRQLRHIPLSHATANAFQDHYTVLGSLADTEHINRLLPSDITTKMARHKEPFSIELYEDSLFVFVNNQKVSDQLLTKMMHYGIWLARHIDGIA